MYAYTNILAALLQRQHTGEGCRIDVSMLECMVEWMGFPLYYAFGDQTPPPRAGAAHATIFPYGPFEVGDGDTVMLGLQNEREWALFCEKVLRQPELAADARFDANPKRVANKHELRIIITSIFSQLTAQEVVTRLDEAGIANAKVNDMSAVWRHPQLMARNRWTTVGTPAGEIPALLPPGVPSSFNARMDPIPAVGQHTDAILRELGFSSEGGCGYKLHAEASAD
jgi:crotonobetainyl-CoA:carnitine CoA-transferase CaiB-like acyl-CoA transferase